MEKLLQFLDHNKFPLVTKLTELNSIRVYSSPIKLQLFVFAKAEDFKDLREPLQDVARKFKSKIMFIYIDIADENLAKPFLTLYGLEDTEDTVVAAFDNKISSKYLLETDPTPANIEDFSSKFVQGSLSPYFKSQSVPDNVTADTWSAADTADVGSEPGPEAEAAQLLLLSLQSVTWDSSLAQGIWSMRVMHREVLRRNLAESCAVMNAKW
ncbi:hypothetical protein NL676_026873 [Syzygium grande]|nr:hypothetical protein NL676_026873 [Syzygium grande]